MTIFTVGTSRIYRFDNDTNYITCGLGYRHKGFYIDLAYVYKQMTSSIMRSLPIRKAVIRVLLQNSHSTIPVLCFQQDLNSERPFYKKRA